MGRNAEIISKGSIWRFDLLMILVMLGTQNNSFHRLLEEIEKLIKEKIITEEVIVQAGHTKFESNNMKIFDLIAKDKLDELQEKADLIITHGGVGSIVSSVEKNKKVIAIPRLHKYGEHVNDHQKEIIQKYKEEGFIIGLEEVEQLKDAMAQVKSFSPKKYKSGNEKMLKIIKEFIDKI